MRNAKSSPSKLKRPARRGPAGRAGSNVELKRVIHELEVYQEEIRIQNQQLIESQRLLEESRDRYANLYDFAPVAYVTLCPNGVIREINRGGADLLGIARSRALESPLVLFIEPASRAGFLQHMQRCRKGGAPVTSELTLRTRDNRRVDVELSSGVGFEFAPAEWRYPTTIFDLTERKRAEEESRRLLAISNSERLLRSVLSALPVGVRVIDAAGNVQLYNQASREIFGDLVDLPIARWEEHGMVFERTGQALRFAEFPAIRALRDGTTVMRELVELPARDGRAAKLLQLSAVPLQDEAGRLVGAVAVSEDVTELKLAESHLRVAKESAETANRVKDNFLAVVSHELRTPLTAILLWARMLRQRNLVEPTRSQAVEAIEQSAQSQLRLVDDLLDVSRIVAGKLRLVVRPMRLAEVIEAALAAARPSAQVKGVQLIEELPPSAWMAKIDSDRMRQVLVNLLSNAIKFTPEGGWVRISMRREAGRGRIEVSDNGRGIEPDFVPHVFDPFRQGDPATTRTSGGLGLGLSIAKQLVELQGGTIGASSAGPNQGSTFFVEIPISRATAPARHGATGATAGNGNGDSELPLDKLRVLLVEDDRDTRTAVQLLLHGSGADVMTAASAREGRELFEQHKPQVLISDIAMPDENGYQLLNSIRLLERQHRASHPVPAIALTAFASDDDRRRALSAGFEVHMPKPFDPGQLIRHVKRLAKSVIRPTSSRRSKAAKP
jgi:PAS domain S-box-containing protein